MTPNTPQPSFVAMLLRRRYWMLAIILTLAVWAGLALAMRPSNDYASRPYGLTTGIENSALDLLFQLRDARHPELRQRGPSEPITIIEIDDATIKASKVRIQKWPRDLYARLIRSSQPGRGFSHWPGCLSQRRRRRRGRRQSRGPKTDQVDYRSRKRGPRDENVRRRF
jgi:hypothetical protein